MTLEIKDSNPNESAYVYLNGGGTYTISATQNEVHLFNRDGQQSVIAAPGLDPRLVAPGEQVLMNLAGEAPVAAQLPGPLNFLQPANFQTTDVDALVNYDNVLLADLLWPWQCGSNDSSPQGRYELGMPDGRPAVRLVRGEGATTPGSTTCSQSPGPSQTGRDVTEYSSLIFKSSFYIESQSLTQCGFEGSECALTLILDYVYTGVVDGETRDVGGKWYHGFYVKADPERQLPTRCSSCQVEHDYVYPGTWFTYESPNILSLLPDDQRPTRLLRAGFYASGHEYDVYVGDVALYAN